MHITRGCMPLSITNAHHVSTRGMHSYYVTSRMVWYHVREDAFVCGFVVDLSFVLSGVVVNYADCTTAPTCPANLPSWNNTQMAKK